MGLNQFFTKYENTCEQDLFQDLIVEATQRYGVEIFYLPRVIADQSDIFGEDPLGSFDTAVSMEVYPKNVEGWEGEGDILTQVGLEVRDRITFTLPQFRWDQLKTEKLLSECGDPMLLETSNTASPLSTDYDHILLESGTANGYSLGVRPLEGDLIYFPMVGKIFVIRFVEHDEMFYQLGKSMVYDLVCELWDYSSEQLDTGFSAIDDIETEFSADVLDSRIILEDGSALLLEDGVSFMILESGARPENTDTFANNEVLEIDGEDFIDFSEKHPFQWGGSDF